MVNLTRTRMWRLMQLDRRIKAGRFPNCSSFARELAAETGMNQPYDRKTIQRDIDFLRDQLRAPLVYDERQKGYYYTDSTWVFPMLSLSEGELLQLLLAKQMAELFQGTPLADTLEGLFRKIRFALPDAVEVDPVIAREQFSFHSHPVRSINRQIWETIFRAMRKDQVMRITYRNPTEEEADKRDVEPLHLACVDGEWYLVAYCRMREDLRHFAVSRIESARMTKKTFEPQPFDPDTYFENRFGRFIGAPGETIPVKVRFAPSATHWVLERKWHACQTVGHHSDGGVTISFPVPSIYEAKRWVLQWGPEARVMAPQELKDAIREEVEQMFELYPPDK